MARFLTGILLYILLILLTFSWVGCTKAEKRFQIEPGTTTAPMLKAALGEPVHEWAPADRPQAQLLQYPDGCSFQLEREVVVGVSCPPKGNETRLQYWRHKWVGEDQRFEEIPGSANVHGQKFYQLASKRQGISVIYEEATERVIRVVKYGKP